MRCRKCDSTEKLIFLQKEKDYECVECFQFKGGYRKWIMEKEQEKLLEQSDKE